jgi:hypothetical protein
MNDLGFPINLRLDVLNSVEQDNLAEYARRKRVAGVERGRPVLEILLKFTEQEIHRAAYLEHDYLKALKALNESRVVCEDLVRYGHPEFEEHVKAIKAGIARIGKAARTRLVRDYLNPKTKAEDVQVIQEALVELVERGAWPEWRVEFGSAVEMRRRLDGGG